MNNEERVVWKMGANQNRTDNSATRQSTSEVPHDNRNDSMNPDLEPTATKAIKLNNTNKKSAINKSPAKTKKSPEKLSDNKSPAKTSAALGSSEVRAPAKTKRSPNKKSPAKKSPAKKSPAKKSPAKKSPANKAHTKKSTADIPRKEPSNKGKEKKVKTERGRNWTKEEMVCLAKEAGPAFRLLRGRQGPTVTNAMKEKKWKEIATKVNGVNAKGDRTWEQVRKKWQDLESTSRTKERSVVLERRKTGGERARLFH